MLITMDGLMAASPSANVEKLLSMKVAKPTEVIATGPTTPQLFKQNFQGQPTVLVSEAAGGSNAIQ
jgi:hypothetical protein